MTQLGNRETTQEKTLILRHTTLAACELVNPVVATQQNGRTWFFNSSVASEKSSTEC